MDSYFSVHQTRFIESWAFLHKLQWSDKKVLDVGGIGPIAQYACIKFGAIVSETKDDLRGSLDLQDNSFDIILCTETIEHIKDVDSTTLIDLEAFNFSGVLNMLRELNRIGRNGCKVFITTPNASSFITLYKWVKREPLLMDPNHVREFTVRDLEQKCRSANLILISIKTINTWGTNFGSELHLLQSLLEKDGYDLSDRGDNIFGLFEVPNS